MKTFSTPFLSVSRAPALITLILFANAAQAGVPYSTDACSRISEGARLSGTKALVIGYEGQFSSSPLNANLLARYRDKLAHGQKAHRPLFLFGGSFLTRGPLVKIIEAYKNKVEVLVFGRTRNEGPSSVPAQCAKIWKAAEPGRKVIIVGHSFGGGAAWQLAHSLETMGVSVDGVVTADPRSPAMCGGECWSWPKPANVSAWENCYQSTPLKGHPVPGANNHFQGAIGHLRVQNTPCVYDGIARIIDGVKAPLTTAPLIFAGEGKSGGEAGSLPDLSKITGGSKDGTSRASEPPAAPKKIGSPFATGASALGAYGPGGVAAPGSIAEKNRMDRTAGNMSAASGLGTAITSPEDNVVHYVRPGGKDPDPRSATRSLNATGASRPIAAEGGAYAGGTNKDGAARTRGPQAFPASDATTALGALWSAKASGSPAGGAAPALAAASGTAPSSTLSPAGGLGASNTEAASTIPPEEKGASPAEPPADLSLFMRVHSKLEHYRAPAAK